MKAPKTAAFRAGEQHLFNIFSVTSAGEFNFGLLLILYFIVGQCLRKHTVKFRNLHTAGFFARKQKPVVRQDLTSPDRGAPPGLTVEARITSYNVCYTKLLRLIPLIRYFTNLHPDIYSKFTIIAAAAAASTLVLQFLFFSRIRLV